MVMFWDYLALHWPTAIADLLGRISVGKLLQDFQDERREQLTGWLHFFSLRITVVFSKLTPWVWGYSSVSQTSEPAGNNEKKIHSDTLTRICYSSSLSFWFSICWFMQVFTKNGTPYKYCWTAKNVTSATLGETHF